MRCVVITFAVGFAIASAACVSSDVTYCSDGSTCPADSRCDDSVQPIRCIGPTQIAACDGLADGQACFIDDLEGACRNGACDLFFCGDLQVNLNEDCDGEAVALNPDQVPYTCLDFGYYEVAGLACDSKCRFVETGCGGGFCGDGTVNGPELCDTTANQTCISIGFDAGSTTCNGVCGLALGDCTRIGWSPESLNGMVALAVGGSARDDQWAVGDGGRAMRYEGAFWNPYPTNVSNPLIAVASVTRDDAWLVGLATSSPMRPSVVLRWNGTVWSPVTVPAASYVDVWAANATNVYLASSDLGIQAWNGATWSELGMITGTPIAIRGSSPSDIWVATNEGPLMRWNGSTWTASSLINAKIRFLDVNAPDDVWAIGHDDVSPSNGVIAHWDGATWTTWRVNGEIYNNVASSGPTDAWVIGADDTMRHFDGVAWSKTLPIGASSSGLAAISGLISFGANDVVAVSSLNLAYRYRGLSFGRFAQLPVFTENTAMWSTAADDMYVGNAAGEIRHFDGVTWQLVFTVPGDSAVTSLWGHTSTDVWFSTADGRVYRGSGSTWVQDTTFPTLLIRIDQILGFGPADVWAFGPAGAFHHDGQAWTRFVLSPERVLSASGAASDDVWAVTDDAPIRTLWHWNGTAWSQVTTGSPFIPNAVVAVTSSLVFVGATEGRILRFDGTSWTEDVVPAASELKFMAATATDDVIAASERELFHHDGRQWSPMRPPIDFVPNTPDYVPMRGLAATPGRIDMLLQRLRVRTLIRTRPIACREREQDLCGNAIDDDCDGKLDSVDDECL